MNTLEKSFGRVPSDYVMDPYCPMFLEVNIGKELYQKLNIARTEYMKECLTAEIRLLKTVVEVLEKMSPQK